MLETGLCIEELPCCSAQAAHGWENVPFQGNLCPAKPARGNLHICSRLPFFKVGCKYLDQVRNHLKGFCAASHVFTLKEPAKIKEYPASINKSRCRSCSRFSQFHHGGPLARVGLLMPAEASQDIYQHQSLPERVPGSSAVYCILAQQEQE